MPFRDPLRYIWDSINHPKGGVFLLLLSAFALLVLPSAPFIPRVLAGVWLVYLAARIAEEAASWLHSRKLSPRELLEERGDFRTIAVALSPEEIAARLPALFAPPLWKARVYRERTRYYFEARGLLPVQCLKLLLFGGAALALLGLLIAPFTDKAVQSPLVPGDTLNLEGTGLSFRLEGVSSGGLEGRGAFVARDKVVKAGRIAFGRPLIAGVFSAVPVGRSPALKVNIAGGEPFVLYPGGKELSGEVTIPFFMPNDEKYIFIPGHRLILRLVLTPKSEESFSFEVFREGAERAELKREITGPEVLEVMGIEVSVAPTACFQVRFARVISLWLVASGLLIVALALLGWFAVPAGRVFGFIQKEERGRINWVQEDSLRLPPLARLKG